MSCRRRSSSIVHAPLLTAVYRGRRRSTYRALAVVSIVLVGLAAGVASAGSDPRVCQRDGKVVHSRACARTVAVEDMRRALDVRLGGSLNRWQGSLTCVGNVSALRWVCSFRNGAEHGWALVTLGSAPAWRQTVTMKSLACDAQTDRLGCTFPP